MADLSNPLSDLKAAKATMATDAPVTRLRSAADDLEQMESSGQMCVNRAWFIPRAERPHVWCLTDARDAL